MAQKKINIRKKFKGFFEHWSPKIIAEMNDYQFKLARIKGDFIWHSHDETDEVFIVIEGTMKIEFRNGSIELKEGEIMLYQRVLNTGPMLMKNARSCWLSLVEL